MTEVRTGRRGRQSKSLTAVQVDGVLTKTAKDRLHHYIVMLLFTGERTEELRGLSWEQVYPDGLPDAKPPCRYTSTHGGRFATGATPNKKSKRTLAPPARCIETPRRRRAQQAADRLAAGPNWQETRVVVTTKTGTEMDAANMRRDFRRALGRVPGLDPQQVDCARAAAPITMLSDADVPLEAISQLVGHSGTTFNELVYRHQLRPSSRPARS